MQDFIDFWKDIILDPINTLYNYHNENQGDLNEVGIVHFFIALIFTGLMFGVKNVKNYPFLSFSGILYYFIIGLIFGMVIFLMYNLILSVSLKLIFIVFNLEGQYYVILNIVLLSSFVFLLNVFSITTTYNLNGLAILLFLLISIIQSFLLEEEYYAQLIYKYIGAFILTYISFSLLSYITFQALNSFM